VVFVGDRGMVTSHNVDLVREHGHSYIVGRDRRRSGEVFDYIQSATGPWIECPVGITAREKLTPPKTLVQEVRPFCDPRSSDFSKTPESD
jgi:hypothetical protein